MKSLNWNGLFTNKFKKIGLIFAAIYIGIDIINKIYGVEDKAIIIDPIYYIIMSLNIAMFSKEKVEDERTQIIRHFALKLTFTILILTLLFAIPLTKIFHSNFSYYCIIIPILCYFPIFELANYYNPAYIFKEGVTHKGSEQLSIMALSTGVIMFIISMIINLVK